MMAGYNFPGMILAFTVNGLFLWTVFHTTWAVATTLLHQ